MTGEAVGRIWRQLKEKHVGDDHFKRAPSVLDQHQELYDEWLARALAMHPDRQFDAATKLAANVGYELIADAPHPDATGPGAFEAAAERAFARSGTDTATVTAEDYCPVCSMTDAELVAELERCARQFAGRDEGGGGSPGEQWAERAMEIETEQRRRAGAA